MVSLIELESETESSNKLMIDSDNGSELYIITDNTINVEYSSNTIRLSYEQVRELARALNIWLDTGKKE